ncbi:MAG: serine/threonine protein kinase, partial [Acutalibacteraceae bacterium]
MANCKCMNCMGDFNDSISEICPHCGHSKNEINTDMNVLSAGTVLISRYMLGNKIKDNSTGFNYIAWDNSNGKKVIIKEYFPKELCRRTPGTGNVEISGSSSAKFSKGKDLFLERGQNFMEKAADLPGMAKAVDLFCENNTAYIVLEHIEGVSVGEVIESQKMPWNSFKDIIRPVIRTVARLHKLKLTDQCIDPDNIVVTSDRKVMITDFDCLNENKVSSSRSINKDHDNYAAIELYRSGSRLTPACDVYSIAAVIYRTITGADVPEASERAKKDTLMPPSELGAEIDKDTENALLNALEVEAANRTQNCDALYHELFEAEKVDRRSSGSKGRASKKTIAVVSVIAVIIVAAVIGVLSIVLKPDLSSVETAKAVGTVPNLINL